MTEEQRIEEMRADRLRIRLAAQGIKAHVWTEKVNPNHPKSKLWTVKSNLLLVTPKA